MLHIGPLSCYLTAFDQSKDLARLLGERVCNESWKLLDLHPCHLILDVTSRECKIKKEKSERKDKRFYLKRLPLTHRASEALPLLPYTICEKACRMNTAYSQDGDSRGMNRLFIRKYFNTCIEKGHFCKGNNGWDCFFVF